VVLRYAAAGQDVNHEDAAPPVEVRAPEGEPATAAGDAPVEQNIQVAIAGQVEEVAVEEEHPPEGEPIDATDRAAEALVPESPTASEMATSPAKAATEDVPKIPAPSRIVFHSQPVPAEWADAASVQAAPSTATDGEDVLEAASEGIPAAGKDVPDEVLLEEAEVPPEAPKAPAVPEVLPVGAGSVVAARVLSESPPQEPVPAQTQSEITKLRRCEVCGFPVSEGRQLCLDCEKNKKAKEGSGTTKIGTPTTPPLSLHAIARPATARVPAPVPATMPQFLGEEPAEPSWLAAHKYMVAAVAIAVAGIDILLLVR
jgi:hypothetical protein